MGNKYGDNYTKDAEDSKWAMLNVVIPKLQSDFSAFAGQKFSPVEGEDNRLLRQLDSSFSVDWVVGNKFVASRVQWGEHNWDSYTIRTRKRDGGSTEMQKIALALADGGSIRPYWHVQAYIIERGSTGLLFVAVVKTEELFKDVEAYGSGYKERQDPGSKDWFLVVFWKDLLRHGVPVAIWHKDFVGM